MGMWFGFRSVRSIHLLSVLFSLIASFGLASAAAATGGSMTTIIVNGTNYTVHTFTSSGTFTVSIPMNVEALIIGGGGGAGSTHGGGGGAGGLIYNSSIPVSAQGYSVVIGPGGSGGAANAVNNGNSGTASSFAGLSAVGGGAGHGGYTGAGAGFNGGSGGGAGPSTSTGATYSGGTGTSGQGHNGGSSYGGGGGVAKAGGGGGAGAVGTSAGASQAGNGGAGLQNSITGTNVYYAGGGGGGSDQAVSSTGGSGGGGAGASNYAGSSATYYGSGGGGGGGNFGAGGNGYQGIVIIRYPTEADIGILSPTVGQALPYGTQNVYLNLTTNNANAACKFDKQVAFDFSTAGTLMAGAGTKNHSGIVGGLLSGQNNLVYIECNLTTGKLASYSLTLYVNGPATGGTISSITVNGTNYTLHTFTSGGTFTASTSMNVEALIVAGGGGAGSTHGGGGGGGGLIYNSSIPVSAQGYSIVVGSGGSGGASGAANNGNSGTGSSFAGLSAIGGGAGHAGYTNPGAGSNGGSGGGGGASTSTASTYSGGTGTSGQGRNGGASYGGGGGTARGGGGGGAGAVGTSAGASQVGNGGAGIQNSITGTNVYYAGGGGGGSDNGGTSTGGSGGGGAGAALDAGSNATSYGSGGGAGGGNFGAGGNGYQGIVIIRYPSSSYSMLAAPNASTYGGESTNLSAVFDIRNVTNLTLEKPGAGRIKFPPTHSVNAVGQDYDTHVVIGNGFVSVNTSALDSSFNSTAALIMNLTGIYSGTGAPTIYYYEAFTSDLNAILANGAVCSAPRCTGISWNSTTKLLTFNVSGFSDYGVNGSSGFGGAGGGSTNSTGTLGINITSTNQIAVYTSSSSNNSAFSFIPVTPPAAGSMTLLSNQSSNVTGGDTGFLVENQGNVNVSITVASDKDAANFIGGSSPLFQMFGGANESGACPSLNTSMQDLSGSEITVCPSLAYSDSQDTIWAYVLVKIDSDSPPQTSTATLTFTSTQV